MTINPDVDIHMALEKLGKKPENLNISPPLPPQNIITWEGGDPRPTDDEINAAWIAWKNEDQYKFKRRDQYPDLKEQLDLLYWDKKNGTNKWTEAIDKVKTDYPKA